MSPRLLLALVLLLALIAGLFFFVSEGDPRPSKVRAAIPPEESVDTRTSPSQPLETITTAREQVTAEPHAGPGTSPPPAGPPERKVVTSPVLVRATLARENGATLDGIDVAITVAALEPVQGGSWRARPTVTLRARSTTEPLAPRTARMPEPRLSSADGRFECHLPRHLPDGMNGRHRELHLRATYREGGVGEDVYVELPAELPDGLDLGTLWLRPPDVLLDGVVVDGANTPVAYPQISAVPEGVETESESARFYLLGSFFGDEQGRFRVVGRTEARTFSLRVWNRAFQPNFQAGLATGSRDMRIVLMPNEQGWIVARYVAPQPELNRFVRAKLTRASDGWKSEGVHNRERFEFRPLDAGTYRLRLTLWPLDEELLTLDGLAVVDGKACDDVRLDRIDLSRSITNHAARVSKRDGSPCSWQNVWVERENGSRLDLTTEQNGELWIPSVGPLPKLSIVTRSKKRLPFPDGGTIVVED